MSAAGGGGAGAVVRQGHLRKLKTMKKKYFVLRAETQDCSARLEYFESEKKFRAGAAPRRVLPLKSCYNITRRLDLKQKHVIALFTREEQFCIVADNEQDLHAWLTAILKQHRSDDASEELLHPIQHVWQVNVQKKGLGSSKNIQGLYNLCLTDKTLTLVKIKSHNNVISNLDIPERIEYTLRNIRRCGDSECFFYMEVGRQTATGAGELWMHSDDSNIAQSMHSTIYLAMRNCAKETENERDHIILPVEQPRRTQSYSQGCSGSRPALSNDKGLCVGSCIKQCVCESAAYSIDDPAVTAPLTTNAENQPPNNSLTSDNHEKGNGNARVIKHHRTVSLPTGCPLFPEPLRVVHERTRSAPLTGDEVDGVTIERVAAHSSCKAVNGTDAPKKTQWTRRASTGTRLSKLSPAHSKNAGSLRTRSDSMPSRTSSTFEAERPPPRHHDLEVAELPRDEPDAPADWYRTPCIQEEPDCVDVNRDFHSSGGRVGGPIPAGASIHHSRTSSFGADDSVPDGYLPMAPGHDPLPPLVSVSSGSVCSGTPTADPRFSSGGRVGLPGGMSIQHSRTSSLGTEPDGYLPMAPGHDPLSPLVSASSGSVCSGTPSTDPRFSTGVHAPTHHSRNSSLGTEPDGYLPMAPGHDPLPPLVSASSGSMCSGTPSTDPRFCEYQLEPATSHIVEGERPPRAWSVGSRGALTSGGVGGVGGVGGARERHRAYSVGARCRPQHHPPHPRAPTSAPLLPRASAEDLMELDFSSNSPQAKVAVLPVAPARSRPPADEYVDMSPRAAGPAPASAPASAPAPPDGYVEMNYTRAATRPIAITASRPVVGAGATAVAAVPAPVPSASPPRRLARTPLGSQTIFPISLDSPASPPDLDAHDVFDDDRDELTHPLTTVREISEEGGRRSPEGAPCCGGIGGEAMAASPQYVRLALAANRRAAEASSTATVVVAGARGNAPARFSVCGGGVCGGGVGGGGVDGSPPATPPPTPTTLEPLNYAALDLQPRRAPHPAAVRTYTQIDFVRSEKLHAADAT